MKRGIICVVLANVLDCDIVISEFELYSRYYTYFWINTFEKRMDPHVRWALVK